MQKNRRIENEAKMLEFGVNLAKILQAGDCLALTGDLGAGKTTLSRGIVQALSGPQDVPSPTYTLVQTYAADSFEVWHCDLYRLEQPQDVYELGLLDVMDEIVSLIEWPDRMGELLPDQALTIDIQFDGDGRLISYSGNKDWMKRLENV